MISSALVYKSVCPGIAQAFAASLSTASTAALVAAGNRILPGILQTPYTSSPGINGSQQHTAWLSRSMQGCRGQHSMVQEEAGLAEHIHEDPRLAKIQAVTQKVGQGHKRPSLPQRTIESTCTYVEVVCSSNRQLSFQRRLLSGLVPKPDARKGTVFWVQASILLQVGTVGSLDSVNQTSCCI